MDFIFRRNAAARERNLGLVERIREGRRGPRPNLDDIPEALLCVVCLGAEREVLNTACWVASSMESTPFLVSSSIVSFSR